eukprot:364950-Chlamydomonas_euryale.AAC.27
MPRLRRCLRLPTSSAGALGAAQDRQPPAGTGVAVVARPPRRARQGQPRRAPHAQHAPGGCDGLVACVCRGAQRGQGGCSGFSVVKAGVQGSAWPSWVFRVQRGQGGYLGFSVVKVGVQGSAWPSWVFRVQRGQGGYLGFSVAKAGI